jgi:hypothetical protein
VRRRHTARRRSFTNYYYREDVPRWGAETVARGRAMDSGWLLADGEAVASLQQDRTPWGTHRSVGAARRGEVAVVLRAPTVVLGPVDVVRVKDGAADRIRAAGRRPVCLLRPGTVIALGPGDAARCGVRSGCALELRWTS